MTDTPTREMQRISVVCTKCGATAEIWIYPEEITSMHYVWSPLDRAYLHTCGRCLYQRSDTIGKQPRSADPERTAHSRRKSGGLHTQEWRVTR